MVNTQVTPGHTEVGPGDKTSGEWENYFSPHLSLEVDISLTCAAVLAWFGLVM